MDEKGLKNKAALAASGFDVASKAAALAPGVGVPTALSLYAVSKALGMVFPGMDLRNARIAAEFRRVFEEATGENWSDEGFFAWAEAKKAEAIFQDLVFEIGRKYVARVSPDVIPALAMLFREYDRQSKPADAFYRNFLSFLCELDADEFTLLQQIFSMVDDAIVKPEVGDQRFSFRATGPEIGCGQRPVYQFEAISIPDSVTKYTPIVNPIMRRLFRLLAKHEVAQSEEGAWGGGPTPISFSRDEIRHLRNLVAPTS